MTKRYKNSFILQVAAYIEKLPGTVVLRTDINELGDPRQISRALAALIEDQILIRIGFGVYAKAEKSSQLERPYIRGGFANACIETLQRFGVKWILGEAYRAYNEGRSQQVPVRLEVRLQSRFRRRLEYGKRTLKIEDNIYAK